MNEDCLLDLMDYLYHLIPNRKHHHATDLLKNFKGYVHSDGYEAYRSINGVINVACFAHARRKYFEILKVIPKDSSFYNLAQTGKEYIDKLYGVEKQISNMSIEDRYKIRQEKSLPILNDYENWLITNPYASYKQFAITKAINYSLNGMKELKNYLLDGRLEIDNNRAERMMKNFVIGRKNFLFCFSEGGADASAVLYSIIETAYANKLRVEDYLTHVFKTLPTINIKNRNEVSKLLPYSTDLPEVLKIK